MCGVAEAALGLQVVGGLMSADAKGKEGAATREYNWAVAKEYDKEAENTQTQAFRDTILLKKRVSEFRGAQKTAGVASGVAANSVTSENIAFDTLERAKQDEIAIQYNATSKANQLKEKANQYRTAGTNAYIAGANNAMASILGSAGDIMGKWKTKNG